MKTVGGIFLTLLGLVFRGFVLQKLWHWFVAPTFQVPELTIPVALGLSLVVMFSIGANVENKKTDWPMTLAKSFALSGGALLFGWVYSLFL